VWAWSPEKWRFWALEKSASFRQFHRFVHLIVDYHATACRPLATSIGDQSLRERTQFRPNLERLIQSILTGIA
jgi:hypothetical protein